MGAVIYRTGKNNLTELGGLAKKMPITAITCIIASLSISGAPGFNGFVSKGMVISSAAEAHKPLLELMLTLAGVGTALSFLKICYFTFFAKNEHIEAKEAPAMMQVAMCATAFLCILTGIYPEALFAMLPYHPIHYHAYSASHVVGVIQLLIFTSLVFMLAISIVSPHRGTVLDFDYFYRMGARRLMQFCEVSNGVRLQFQGAATRLVSASIELIKNPIVSSELLFFRRGGIKTVPPYDENVHRQPVGIGVLFAVLLIMFYCIVFYIRG
jgi:multicomponent Na+:H+ antiporter subunit D